MELEQILESTARQIATHGTASAATTLEALAAAARSLCPAAAEVVVDWSGPEITRLRAFAVVSRALTQQAAAVGPLEIAVTGGAGDFGLAA